MFLLTSLYPAHPILIGSGWNPSTPDHLLPVLPHTQREVLFRPLLTLAGRRPVTRPFLVLLVDKATASGHSTTESSYPEFPILTNHPYASSAIKTSHSTYGKNTYMETRNHGTSGRRVVEGKLHSYIIVRST